MILSTNPPGKLSRDAIADILQNVIHLPGLVSSGSPNDDDHKMLLLVGAACGWDDLVQQLLEHGTRPNAFSLKVCPFRFISGGNPDILTTRNRRSFTDLLEPSALVFAHRGHRHVVQTLLHYGADHEKLGGE